VILATAATLLATVAPACQTHACEVRTCDASSCRERVARRRSRAEMRRYRRRQMPWCTWGPESGAALPPFSVRRYRARNPASTAGGKFQVLDSTFHGVGGADYPGTHDAAQAPPVVQERLARRVLAVQGLRAWVGCR
jgi:hypothetical protein